MPGCFEPGDARTITFAIGESISESCGTRDCTMAGLPRQARVQRSTVSAWSDVRSDVVLSDIVLLLTYKSYSYLCTPSFHVMSRSGQLCTALHTPMSS